MRLALDDDGEFTELDALIRLGRGVSESELDPPTILRLGKTLLAQVTAHALGRPFHEYWPTIGERCEAEDWFLKGDESFLEVCRMAGFSPVLVRREMIARLPKRLRE